MKRRQLLPAMVGLAGITALDWLRSRPANATFLNNLFDSATGSPSNSAPASSAPVQSSTMFAEVYPEQYYISREQFTVLQSGNAVHWWDIAPKPYARLNSTDGSEHYYFPFAFGEGGAIVVCDTTGAIASWDISTDRLVPEFSPADLSQYNYYPPKAKEVAAVPATPDQPTGYPPLPEKQAPLGCY